MAGNPKYDGKLHTQYEVDRLESQQGKIDLGSYSDMQRAILPEAIVAERNKLERRKK